MDGNIHRNIEFNPLFHPLQLGTEEYMEIVDSMRVLVYKNLYCNLSIMKRKCTC